MRDFACQEPGLSQLQHVLLLTKEGIHRPRRSEPDIVEGPKRLNLELWVLEIKARGGFDWIERKESSLGLFIKRLNTKSPPRARLGLTFN